MLAARLSMDTRYSPFSPSNALLDELKNPKPYLFMSREAHAQTRDALSGLGRGRDLLFAEAQDHAERKPTSIIHFIEEVCPQVLYLDGADGDSII